VMVNTGVRIGTAAVALGLSLAGPQAAGVAAAEGDAPGASADSGIAAKAPAPRSGRSARVAVPRAVGSRSAAPRAAAVAVPRAPRRAAAAPTRPVPVSAIASGASAAVVTPVIAAPAAPVFAVVAPKAASVAPAQAVSPVITGIANVLDGVRKWLSTLPANPISDFLEGALLSLRRSLVPDPIIEAPAAGPTAPTITLHNSSQQTIWVYNLPNTGDYSIPAGSGVSIAAGSSAPVTLALNNGPAGSPGNRIYIVEGTSGFTLPITPTSGVDPFYPPGTPAGDAFANYSFIEYNLYPAAGGGNEYTIDTSYIDEWSLPVQMKFTINGSGWTGAVDQQTYGFKDFDTAVSQLNAAGTAYGNLVWSGTNPWDPQPPSTVSRIIGPDKVWAQQSNEPASNIGMNVTGWVPTSYQNFVASLPYNGTQLSGTSQDNFDFWRYSVTGPASTPYAIALRTAAVLDGFAPDANGVYGFFTYPNDEAAGQFTNIPTSVSLDLYVWGSGDGASASVIPGGVWRYSSSVAPVGTGPRVKVTQGTLPGTAATDTFVLNSVFRNAWTPPLVQADGSQGDIIGIDKTALGATSSSVDFVDRALFFCTPGQSQFVYERSTGNLYYDQNPQLPGYTGLLANLSQSSLDPAQSIFVL